MLIARRGVMLGVLAFFVGVKAPYAQSSARDRLSSAKSVTCEFPLYATGTWHEGEPQAEVKATKFSLGFDSIDTQGGTARALGRFGDADIIVRLSQENLHFITVYLFDPNLGGRSTGLYITTVFEKVSRGRKLKAVHTRHDYTDVTLSGFTSKPEQYYGECEIGR